MLSAVVFDEIAQIQTDVIIITERGSDISNMMNFRFCRVADRLAPMKQNPVFASTSAPTALAPKVCRKPVMKDTYVLDTNFAI